MNRHLHYPGRQARGKAQSIHLQRDGVSRSRGERFGSPWRRSGDFLDRVAARLLGATLWYSPSTRARRPTAVFSGCTTDHPLRSGTARAAFRPSGNASIRAVERGASICCSVAVCRGELFMTLWRPTAGRESVARGLAAIRLLFIWPSNEPRTASERGIPSGRRRQFDFRITPKKAYTPPIPAL